MHVSYAAGSDRLFRPLDGTRHIIGTLNFGPLDVDNAEPHSDFLSQVFEHRQLAGGTMRVLHHYVVNVKAV